MCQLLLFFSLSINFIIIFFFQVYLLGSLMDESCSFNHLAGFITEPHELDHGGKFHIPFVLSLAKTGNSYHFFSYMGSVH